MFSPRSVCTATDELASWTKRIGGPFTVYIPEHGSVHLPILQLCLATVPR